MDNISGRRWARTFLGIALAVSLIGNVAHTVLADSTISLWLRIPGAVIWPLFAFGGIEILVRMVWLKTKTHRFARLMVLLPVLPAAITSYEHLRSMLVMMGERVFISNIGPAVVDGMMLGCTLVLLFTRPATTPAELEPVDVDDAEERLSALLAEQTERDWDRAAEIELGQEMSVQEIAPTSPAPQIERAPRSTWDAYKVAEMAMSGAKTAEIVDATGCGRATVDRFRKVARMLQAEPRTTIDPAAEKLRPEYVTMMRELVGK